MKPHALGAACTGVSGRTGIDVSGRTGTGISGRTGIGVSGRTGMGGLLALCLLLLVAPAAAVLTTDPPGDASRQASGPPVDAPSIDILEVEGLLEQGILHLRIEVLGIPPVSAPEPDADRRYTYLFVIAQGQGSGSLVEQRTLTSTCTFHHGMDDLQCTVTEGNATLRGIGQQDRNITMRLAVQWDGPFRLGGAAHESVTNGTQQDIVAQDFTDNALPYQQPPGSDAGTPPPARTPWWKTPWILLPILGVLIAGAWAWATYGGGSGGTKKTMDERRRQRRR